MNEPGGDAGPDGPPWPDFMIRKAWQSPRVLGLQFWNEPAHLETQMGTGDAAERGYEWPLRLGFYTGRFELTPYYDMARRLYASRLTSVERQLHHGAYTWDMWLLRGLDTQETSQLSWLPAGQPRRFFMAAGSDAHGDLNYRRNGYLFGTEKVRDVAIAKARNLVFAGHPALPPDEVVASALTRMPPPRHSHEQITAALASGNFTATDGPALRIVVDRNRNGAIDDGDVPMGGVIAMQGELLPLLVEWRSTAEFGGVTRVSLYVGVHNDRGSVDGSFCVYAPTMHGPRNFAPLPDAAVTESYQQGSCTYVRMRDNYWRDPTGLLDIQPTAPSMGGVLPINLPLSAFQANLNERGNRFYVRAFAETERQDANGCASSADARRGGACIRHYAFTNPIWAITSVPPWKVPAPGSWTCQPRPRG